MKERSVAAYDDEVVRPRQQVVASVHGIVPHVQALGQLCPRPQIIRKRGVARVGQRDAVGAAAGGDLDRDVVSWLRDRRWLAGVLVRQRGNHDVSRRELRLHGIRDEVHAAQQRTHGAPFRVNHSTLVGVVAEARVVVLGDGKQVGLLLCAEELDRLRRYESQQALVRPAQLSVAAIGLALYRAWPVTASVRLRSQRVY